jgi:hypothetical protein
MNLFDNSLIVIDEVHNLTCTLANAKTSNNVKSALVQTLISTREGASCCVVWIPSAINNPPVCIHGVLPVRLIDHGKFTEPKRHR